MRVIHPDLIREADRCEPINPGGDRWMNLHKNACTTPQSRALLVHRVLREHWPVSAVASAFGVSERTV
jgi:hypothetical protein